MMIQKIRVNFLAAWVTVVWIGLCFLYSANAHGGEVLSALEMPANWKVMTDFQVPAEQVKAMSSKLDAELKKTNFLNPPGFRPSPIGVKLR
jgi:hypothetical protein